MTRERPILFTGEMWRPVVGYEGRYEVSDLGRVRSLLSYHGREPGTVLAGSANGKGYIYVCLRRDGRKRTHAVHALVLSAFVGPRPSGKQCAHADGDPSNNKLTNLRWASSKENHRDRRRHGRIPVGEAAGSAALDRSAVRTIKRLEDAGVSATEVAHLACVHPSTIAAIWNGETWRHV